MIFVRSTRFFFNFSNSRLNCLKFQSPDFLVTLSTCITLSKTTLDKMLKDIPGVQLDNHKVFHAPGPRTKYFEHLFLWLNKKINILIIKVFFFKYVDYEF